MPVSQSFQYKIIRRTKHERHSALQVDLLPRGVCSEQIVQMDGGEHRVGDPEINM